MVKYNRESLVVFFALLTGFFGDGLLQGLVKVGMGGKTGWGLKGYFKQHGSAESLFVAAGMMGIFYLVYIATGLPLKIQWIAIYGIVLDLIFRLTSLFPSLRGYYNALNYFWSGVWGVIPMIIPLLILKLVDKDYRLV